MKTILIVDDNKDIHHLLNNFLKKTFDFSRLALQTAHSGSEALRVLKNHHFDLVICDLQMADGNGVFLLEKMRSNRISIPFILFTSSPESAPQVDGEILKAVISKNSTEVLAQKIEKYLEIQRI